MPRHVLSALLLLLMGASVASAQEWARKMFTESSHDFGAAARGAKVEYRFKFSNIYQETVHVASVRSSCGCTTPEVTKTEIKTHEKSEIVARFNTNFTPGQHSATITVTFDKPFFAEVQLNVWGNLRGDIEVRPEFVDLGTTDQGQGAERTITVTHSGRTDWKILDVRSVNTNYEVQVLNGRHNGGQISYDLDVALKKDSPPGYLKDQLILVTNDPGAAEFAVEVEGMVRAELSVSPQVLALGTLEPGQKVTRPVIVSGRKPFTIAAVHCDDESFTFTMPKAAGKVQIIPVTFSAPDKPGKIVKRIEIETDLGKTFTCTVIAQAEVKGAPQPQATSAPTSSDKPDSKLEESVPSAANSTPVKFNATKSEPATSGAANAGADATDRSNLDTVPSDAATPSSDNGNSSTTEPTSIPVNPFRSKPTVSGGNG